MKAVLIDRVGGPEVLQLRDVPEPRPGPGQVLIRHTALGVNYVDTYYRSGLYPVRSLPSGIGAEGVGVVVEVGSGVGEYRAGDRVGYIGNEPGSYAELRAMATDRLFPLPANVRDTDVAALMLKGMTVERLVHATFPVHAGQTVLWHAAAGGVGLIACQWLSSMGVTVIGTVGSPQKAEVARAHGCHHVIDYTVEDFVERVRALTDGRGVPVVFDSVGRTTFDGSLRCLARRGMLVCFGNASGVPPPLEVGLLARLGSLYLTRMSLFTYIEDAPELRSSAAAVLEAIARGRIRADTVKTRPLREAVQAHQDLEGRRTTGSQVLIPSG